MSALHALTEITAPVMSHPHFATTMTRDVPLLLELGPSNCARLAILNDFLCIVRNATSLQLNHASETFPTEHAMHRSLINLDDELFNKAREIYQMYLPRFRFEKGEAVGNGLDFMRVHMDDPGAYGLESDDTYSLGEDICLTADVLLATSACELYFSTARSIYDARMSKEVQQYGSGKRCMDQHEQSETNTRERLRRIRSSQPTADARVQDQVAAPQAILISTSRSAPPSSAATALDEARAELGSMIGLDRVKEELRHPA